MTESRLASKILLLDGIDEEEECMLDCFSSPPSPVERVHIDYRLYACKQVSRLFAFCTTPAFHFIYETGEKAVGT